MKAFLMFPDRDFDLKGALPLNAEMLVEDLELGTLFDAMAAGDPFVHDVSRIAVLAATSATLNQIRYRQDALDDALRNPQDMRALYALAGEAMEREKKAYFGIFRDSPDTILNRSVEVLDLFIGMLRRLRRLAEAAEPRFRSQAFRRLFAMLQNELGEDYLAELSAQLDRLKFPEGVLVSARLGGGNKGIDYRLRLPPADKRLWPLRLLPRATGGLTLHIHPRDEAGGQALSALRNKGLAVAARALGQSADHILSFFQMLRTEMAFYIGGINLRDRLMSLGMPLAAPQAVALDKKIFSCVELYDVCLAISMNKPVVGNTINGDEKALMIITGANKGGKSTFLRSVGLAQLMMQSGLFVGAERFKANIVDGVFTHYKREEDNSMTSGKFDEELSRMNRLTNSLTPHALFLFNESFAATNEREGSQIAEQIVLALLESGLKVVFVTHLYTFAHAFDAMRRDDALFLRAERQNDGNRSFQLIEGSPLETSFGEDLYARIFGEDMPRAAGRRFASSVEDAGGGGRVSGRCQKVSSDLPS